MEDLREEYFKFKLAAFLHDPISKLADIKHHKSLAQEILEEVGIEGYLVDDELIRTADVLSSSLDRMGFKDSQVSLKNFIHPFKRKDAVEVLENLEAGMFRDFIVENIKDLDSYEEKFFKAWMLMNFSKKSEWFSKIPADTRSPNHSIVSHLVRTSSIAGSLKHGSVSFLLFSVGPVQGFIKNSKKTKDLWGSSFLLSFLTWKAMLPIVEEYGPDHIIFPSLSGQPWMKFLMHKKGYEEEKPSLEELSIASFPNRFLAIVPYDEDIAKKCEKSLKDTWKDILETLLKDKYENFEEYTEYFDVNWVMLPWGKCRNYTSKSCLEDIKEELKKLLSEKECENPPCLPTVDEIYSAMFDEGRAYKSNYPISVYYSHLYKVLEKLLAGVKSYKTVRFIPKPSEKYRYDRCSVCGELPAAVEVKVEGDEKKERLCPVCYSKRNLDKYLEKELSGFNYEVKEISRFPSTAEVSAAKVKEKALELIKDKKAKDIKSLQYGNPVPKLKKEYKGINFLFVDSSVILSEDEKVWEEHGVSESSYKDLKDLIKDLKNCVKTIPKYYAVLMMDGDNMGKWLSGEMNKTFEEMMAEDENGESVALDTLKDKKYPMTPALHEEFSKSLMNFSRKVREIVENHYGALIYSGGDDVLALLPIDEVFSAADEIRKKFSETVSDAATMSAGIVISHYKYPLRDALEKVREAEKCAKNEGKRNAFCSVILKHSGEEVRLVSKWKIENVNAVKVLNEIKDLVNDGTLSRSFLYDAHSLIEEIKTDDLEKFQSLADAILSMLIKKKVKKNKEKAKAAMEKALYVFKQNINYALLTAAFITRGGKDEG